MKKLVLSIFLIGLIFAFASSTQSIANVNDSSSCNSFLKNKPFYAESASCAPWNLQPDGCYERVCCCDKDGQHWCERCCPDKTGKCVAYKVKC